MKNSVRRALTGMIFVLALGCGVLIGRKQMMDISSVSMILPMPDYVT